MEVIITELKVVLLGDSRVGKTCIVGKFVTGNTLETTQPTVGVAFLSKTITVDDKDYKLNVWDTAGQEQYRGMAPMYYRNSKIAIICFDITCSQSYDSVQYWIEELRRNIEEDITIIICGNKCDLESERQISFESASKAAEEQNALYCETSAVTGAGIDRMFQLAVSRTIERIEGVLPCEDEGGVSLDQTNQKPKKKCC